MGHNIRALVIRGRFAASACFDVDLRPVELEAGITLLHIDHYYSAYWQAVRKRSGELPIPDSFPLVFPREAVLRDIAAALLHEGAPMFGIIMSEYFGGAGGQWGCLLRGTELVCAGSVNDVLRGLGVQRSKELDEWDTVGLVKHRSSPGHLEKYAELCEEMGI